MAAGVLIFGRWLQKALFWGAGYDNSHFKGMGRWLPEFSLVSAVRIDVQRVQARILHTVQKLDVSQLTRWAKPDTRA